MVKQLRYIILLLAATLALGTYAAMPRLTVVIVIDGLRQDNLSKLRPYWQQGGLRTLSEEAYQTTIGFPHPVYGGNETTATLMTGLLPREHGYAMDNYFLRTDRRVHSLLEDKSHHGIGTTTALSPRALLAPTLADQLRLSEGKKAKIYAVGISPETTILLAGHSANACCWINAEGQRWATTSYYTEGLPDEADRMNVSGRFSELAAREWIPRMSIPSYNTPTDEEKKRGFNYSQADVLPLSPVANELVVELALNIQRDKQLGVDIVPDMLLLQLNAMSPKATSDHIASAEHEDMYLWLNQHIGFLMEQLNKRIGKENYQLLVVGRPILGTGVSELTGAGLMVQQFNVDRAAALASTYLMALYGHERWIDGGYGQSIYLNRTLIEKKKLSLSEIQKQVATLLMDFEGVQLAFPALEATHHPDLFPSYAKRCFGDVIFTLQPGWQLMENNNRPLDKVIDNAPEVPLMYWSGTIRPFPENKLTALDIYDILRD
ncbi:MAG: alkaline phosphatase family protein [Paludibacteraceae bacterium]|nr:alkaline phosphatase family protein [Paludibacteraceae bacterium]